MTIPLHPEKGINAILAYCPSCHRQNSEIVLAGNGRVYTCNKCGRQQAGYRAEKCSQCGNPPTRMRHSDGFTSRPIEDSDKIMGGLCDECKKERDEHAAIVAAGGVYFRCKCGASGVIKADAPIAAHVREQLKLPAPAECGLEVDTCHICKPEDFVEEDHADQS